jgi:hypothetical protein
MILMKTIFMNYLKITYKMITNKFDLFIKIKVKIDFIYINI